jgi:voltage-gated potassium channel
MKFNELKPAYYSIAFLAGLLIIGISGYMIIEHYQLLDAYFMTIITITTVGFREINPLSPAGKIFTSILIIISFGFFAFSVTTLTRYIFTGVFFNYYKYSKVIKEIDKLENHVIVVGYGRNGSQAIEELTHRKIPLVVIENREEKVKEIKQAGNLLYIEDDPSSDEVLIKAGVKKAKVLISVLASDEENLFVVLTAHVLNPKITIISRAINFNTVKKLKTAGASHVIMPDKISGQHMAKMIAQPFAIEFLDYLLLEKSREFILGEVSCLGLKTDSSVTLGLIEDRYKLNLNIIGLKRKDGNYLINPGMDTALFNTDYLFVLGKPSEVDKLKQAINM